MTREEIAQLGELIDNKLKPINKKLETIEMNMVAKSDLEANNRTLGTIILGSVFKIELAEIANAIKAGFMEMVRYMKKGFQETNKKIDNIAVNHEARITQLEETEELIHKN